ncbi:MAG TPA: glycosyltransferase family 87 protein [Beijerinckiaceae bacterium]|nr:glycosyltransferase family 87 protein [Beijerinckiaceae bacterium]
MLERGLRLAAGIILATLAVMAIAPELQRVTADHGLWDFGSFVASGRAAREGLDPYGIYPLTLHVSLPGFETWNPNLNPPISALLFQAFDLAEPQTSLRVWSALSVALYAAAVGLLLLRYGPELGPFEAAVLLVWAFGLAGFWDTLFLGQIYIPLVLAAVLAWLLLERGRGAAAGILIGCVVAMKPNFLVWPAVLLLAGHGRPALWALATAAAISLVPILALGPEVYRQWLELVAADRDRGVFLTNASLGGLAARLGAPALGTALGAALLAGLALWAWRRRPGLMEASTLALLGALLASPLAWIHYTLFLLPVFFARWSIPAMRAPAALLIVPVPFVIDQLGREGWVQATIGSVYGWGLVLCLLVVIAGARARPGAVAPLAAKPA